MKTLSSSEVRKNWNSVLHSVSTTKRPIIIEKHNKGIAMIIDLPAEYSEELSDITNMALYGGAFDWLADEPDLYSAKDAQYVYKK